LVCAAIDSLLAFSDKIGPSFGEIAMLRLLLIAILGFIAGIFIVPARSMADFAYSGLGATSCGKLADDYRNDPTTIEIAMMTWAQGYMSGMNVSSITQGRYRDLAAMTLDAQKQSLLSYCDNHPLAEFIKAAIDLYLKLPLKKYSPPPSR
jgi:hypothetical protein